MISDAAALPPDDVATAVLDRMEEVGLVDDSAYADMLVRSQQAGRGLARRALAQELRRRLIAPRRAAVVELLRSGVEQGELRGDLEVEAAIDGLYGALYYRLLVSHEPLTEPYVETIIEQALDGIGAPSANA